MKEKKLVEIARSFGYKLNVGNYESRDFFCSQKIECYEDESKETSQRLYEFCKIEVLNSVSAYKRLLEEPKRKKERIMEQLSNEFVENSNIQN